MRTRFITSAPDPTGFPATAEPEIAFIGRSNVGKSSLLNRLANARIARTSKTPGRTQLVNFFEVHAGERRYVLADLPGYGFAKAPKAVRAGFHDLIEGYLTSRGPLRAVLMLIDCRRDVQDEDQEIYDWLAETLSESQQMFVILTKIDKLPKSKQKPAMARIGKTLGAQREQVFSTSASTGQGLEDLQAHLESLIG